MPVDEMKEPQPDERNLELENMMGNYQIAQYQVSRLMAFFDERIGKSTDVDKDGRPMLKSAHTFKFNDKWYRISMNIRQISLQDLLTKD